MESLAPAETNFGWGFCFGRAKKGKCSGPDDYVLSARGIQRPRQSRGEHNEGKRDTAEDQREDQRFLHGNPYGDKQT
jgi:hypothetical protein